MANIQEQTMDQVERFVMAFLGAAIGQIYDVSSFSINALARYLKEKESKLALSNEGGLATLKEFEKALQKKEAFHTLKVADETLADYLQFLNKNNILYVVVKDIEKNVHGILFRDRDLDKMQEIQRLLNLYHKGQGEITIDSFRKIYDEKAAGVDFGITNEEAELFNYFAKEKSFLYSVHENVQGKKTLLYDPKDRDAVQEALTKASWVLNGEHGPKVLEQINFRLEGRSNIAQSLSDGMQEYYVVSKHNPKNYVHITESQITQYKQDQVIHALPRDSEYFMERAWNMVESISSPVLMAPEEFAKDNLQLRQKNLDAMNSLNLFPDSMEIEEEMQEYNRLRDLVCQKMNLDNEHQGDWALYCDALPFSEFAGRENFNDCSMSKESYEKLQKSMKESAEKHSYHEIQVEDTSLDKTIRETALALEKENSKDPDIGSRQNDRSRG